MKPVRRLFRKRSDAALERRRRRDEDVVITIDPFDELAPERLELDDDDPERS